MIKLIVLDVDGTLTQGKITYTNEGLEIKSFDVKDGLAVSAWKRLGYEAAIVMGRESQIVKKRAQDLGITHVYQGVRDKYSLLLGLCEELSLDFSEVAAIGDDINDRKMLWRVGKSFAPSDGVALIRKEVDVCLKAKGGEGAVREMVEHILHEQDKYEDFLELFA